MLFWNKQTEKAWKKEILSLVTTGKWHCPTGQLGHITQHGHSQVSVDWTSLAESRLEHLVLLLWVPEAAPPSGGIWCYRVSKWIHVFQTAHLSSWADRKNSSGLSVYTYAHMTMSAMRVVGATITITSAALATCVCSQPPQISAVFCNKSYHICKLGNGHFKIHCDRIRHIFHRPDELVVLGEEFVK